jgi:hypothetical protein
MHSLRRITPLKSYQVSTNSIEPGAGCPSIHAAFFAVWVGNLHSQPATPKAVGPTAGGAEDYPQQAHTQYSSQSTTSLAETPFKLTHAQQKPYRQKTRIFAHPSTITPTESTKHSYTAQFFTVFRKIISNKTNTLPQKTA